MGAVNTCGLKVDGRAGYGEKQESGNFSWHRAHNFKMYR